MRHVEGHCHTVVINIKAMLTSSPVLAYQLGKARGKMGPIHVVYSSALQAPLRSRVIHDTGRVPAVLTAYGERRTVCVPCVRTKYGVLIAPRGSKRISLSSLVQRLKRLKVSDIVLRNKKALG